MRSPSDFDRALVRLLNAFDEIADTHGEVLDTMVRELTFGAIYRAFIVGEEGDLPGSFGMFSGAGNAAVRSALADFLGDPAVRAMIAEATPQQRLDAFQAPGIASADGATTDEYFGYLDALPGAG